MQGTKLTFPVIIPGTLTADINANFQAPFDLQLVAVSAKFDNTPSVILDIGTTSDTDAYLDGVTVTGAAAACTLYTRADFVDDQFPHISAGDEVQVTVDYDGGAGGDGANLTVTLFFTEG